MILRSIFILARGKVFNTWGRALRGYDPVAYFISNKPIKGKRQFSYRWKNALWLFSSAENLALFRSQPEKYAPQFGGFCAYGTSNGYKAKTQPELWTIVNDKLYLNYSKEVELKWKANQAERIQRAEFNWVELENKDRYLLFKR